MLPVPMDSSREGQADTPSPLPATAGKATTFDVFQAASQPDWQAIVEHRFVREMVRDELPDAVLRDYLVQDWQFCDLFVSVMAQAAASADTMGAKMRLCQQLGFFASQENTYFDTCFARFNVTDAELSRPALKPATAKFLDLMQKTLETRSYPHALVLLVVAEATYLAWAEGGTEQGRILPQLEQNRGWVDLHRGEYFSAWVQFLVDDLNRVASPSDKSLMALFRQAVALEREFMDDAYVRH